MRSMSIWRVPAYLPYLQPALTEAAVAEAEAELGVKLPESYLALLREQNGGYLRRGDHPSGHAPVNVLAGIGPSYPHLQRDWSGVKSAMAEMKAKKPKDIDRLIAFCGDGHYYYCLDYRKPGEPRVTYIDVECFDKDEVLAPDFATFLSQLTSEPEEAWGLVTDLPGKKVAAALSEASGSKFVDGGDQDNGYHVYRAALGPSQWAWLSANRCRKGFVRKGERNHAKLSKLMPELVDRHPEHADCAWFLTCNALDGRAGKKLVASLAELPFPNRRVTLG